MSAKSAALKIGFWGCLLMITSYSLLQAAPASSSKPKQAKDETKPSQIALDASGRTYSQTEDGEAETASGSPTFTGGARESNSWLPPFWSSFNLSELLSMTVILLILIIAYLIHRSLKQTDRELHEMKKELGEIKDARRKLESDTAQLQYKLEASSRSGLGLANADLQAILKTYEQIPPLLLEGFKKAAEQIASLLQEQRITRATSGILNSPPSNLPFSESALSDPAKRLEALVTAISEIWNRTSGTTLTEDRPQLFVTELTNLFSNMKFAVSRKKYNSELLKISAQPGEHDFIVPATRASVSQEIKSMFDCPHQPHHNATIQHLIRPAVLRANSETIVTKGELSSSREEPR